MAARGGASFCWRSGGKSGHNLTMARYGRAHKTYEHIQFDFLGYAFRPRKCKDRYGRIFANFTRAIGRGAARAIRQTVRGWCLQLKSDKSIDDLARMFGPERWVNYYCHFRPSGVKPAADHLNKALARWAERKFKRLRGITVWRCREHRQNRSRRLQPAVVHYLTFC